MEWNYLFSIRNPALANGQKNHKAAELYGERGSPGKGLGAFQGSGQLLMRMRGRRPTCKLLGPPENLQLVISVSFGASCEESPILQVDLREVI